MKNKKRNITMMAVLVFVCAAVALNWSYNRQHAQTCGSDLAADGI